MHIHTYSIEHIPQNTRKATRDPGTKDHTKAPVSQTARMSDEHDLQTPPADAAATEVDAGAPSTPPTTGATEEIESTAGALDGNRSEESFTEVKISDADEPVSTGENEPEASESRPTRTATPPTTTVGPSEEVDESPAQALNDKRPSLPSIQTPGLQGRDLPPLPDPSPILPRAGIPIPISTDRPISPAQLEPRSQTPATPMRSSSRNAHTTSNQNKRISTASLSTNNGAGQATLSSMVFVVQALESIGASKDGRRRKSLADSVQRALNAIKDAAPSLPPDPVVVFEPLQIACTVQNTQVITTALDCIGKLISYSYFSIVSTPPAAPPPAMEGSQDRHPQKTQPEIPLIEKAIETICDCFQGDATPDQVQLQIIKALLAAVLNDKAIVHGAGLLKAVRQTYNIFLLSRNSPNQMTAQGTLTQMVHTVFERVKIRISMKEANMAANGDKRSESPTALNIPMSAIDEGSSSIAGDGDSLAGSSEMASTSVSDNRSHEKITLQSFENRKSFDDERIADNAPTTVTHSPRTPRPGQAPNGSAAPADEQDDEDEIFIKDAFLVFRAMCKLSIKTLPPEQIADLKSHGMRSKLLSLHLIHTILQTHMSVFVSPLSTIRSSSSAEATGFIHAVKQYLCLSLSRNAASAVGLVFEVCCEIFWLIISHMRVMLKVNPPPPPYSK